MNIIDQLEQAVTSAVLGSYSNNDNSSQVDNGSVSHVSLLEQFYAILAARLALPQVYSQLLRDDQPIANDNIIETPLFEQLWQAPSARQVIIQELAATHHIDEFTTTKLIMNAVPLAYRELKVMANGQFLPAFLQSQQPFLRHYLPIWAAPVITAAQHADDELFNAQSTVADIADMPVLLNKYDATEASRINPSANSLAEPNTAAELASKTFDNSLSTSAIDTGAIHANPAAHHLEENSSLKREKVRTRNQRNDLLIRVFLLFAAMAAIGLVWALLIRPNNAPPVEPVVPAPTVIPPVAEPPAQVLTPVALIVGVDNGGNLYTCSASVGDAALQSTLQQALNSSFGEQAAMCQFTVQEGVANNIANMPIEALPNVLTLLRATPFARLQLQNDRMTLEAPDSMQLQRLATDIRTLVPAMMVDSTAPLPLPNNDSGMGAADMAAINGVNNQYDANNNVNANGNNDYQAADDDTGDSVIPAPGRNNDFNNPPMYDQPSNNAALNNAPMNNDRPASTRPPGPFSVSEVDDMANSVIVAEPAQVRR
ncbi:hypothetical protein FHS24_001277 [Psychrobacter luti]|uniref:Uncharacterized protein n=1 Tax=Psychrobacter luti TaxID=198481 RepID=A0A839TED5_9GAMM|nr:hypothetical protein [Psychrobacter luti]MBB3106776.1 hypothetical protein [Psychrobacter luti]